MKILVSSCLLGENVRYNGFNSLITQNNKLSLSNKDLFKKLLKEHEIISFCPEISGGLSTPREAVERNKNGKFLTKTGFDNTKEFLKGAKDCLALCQKEGIKIALLKAKSPSCGNEKVYDGTFTNTLINGSGICAKTLLQNGIKVFNETQIQQLYKYINSHKSSNNSASTLSI